ncbi:MAG TPA: hypothetical protein PKM65_06000 [Spirochaetota bacterium]|nr:hypothetical protein [Spirochaetota bacterium]HNT10091.1 hypothetical protein [Spirochaetota bacterium]HNV47243.1 hypothetical protein [Spirochaetota bacterium]HOS38824.1 hypothetical protein [Spirochaetota bacterium]HPU86908.1 hypothetical protein [Spirochaetota bacterium]
MKALLLALIVCTLMISIGCGTTGAVKDDGAAVPADAAVIEGWITPEKFRVRAEGSPAPGITDPEQKKKSARDAAVENAQKLVIKNFVSTRVHSASGKLDIINTGIIITRNFGGTVRGGTVVQSRYDSAGRCTVYYEVTDKDLKKRVQTAGAQ